MNELSLNTPPSVSVKPEHALLDGVPGEVVEHLASSETFSDAKGKNIVVALASIECFAIQSSQFDRESFRSPTKLAFALEQFLPVDAENLAVAYDTHSRRQDSLVIACLRQSMLSFIDRIESEGRWIAAIAPRCLLAVQELMFDKRIPGDCVIFWQSDDDAWDFLEVKGRRPVRWSWIDQSNITSDLPRNVFELTNKHCLLFGPTRNQIEPLLANMGLHIEHRPEVLQYDFANRFSQKLIRGTVRPWFDLRSDQLPTRQRHKPISNAMFVLISSLLLGLSILLAVVLVRIANASKVIGKADLEQVALFQRLFPGQAIPTDIVGRLRSEERRLTESANEMRKQPPVYSSFPTLVHFLNHLPEEATFRIDSIALKSEQITSVDGAARTLDDFQTLLETIRSSGYEYSQPDVTQMKDGFKVRLEKLSRTASKKPEGTKAKP